MISASFPEIRAHYMIGNIDEAVGLMELQVAGALGRSFGGRCR